ncbi:MAG: hypothetical protein IKA06_04945, partial [Clostridia bacterium]|nr:hypothetical protein [Clostridia bacterium]
RREQTKIFSCKSPKIPYKSRVFGDKRSNNEYKFQDRLVMTTSITLRKYDATACIIFTESVETRLGELLLGESASHTPPEDRQARLSGAGRGYFRRKAK